MKTNTLIFLITAFFLLTGCTSLRHGIRSTSTDASHESVMLSSDVRPLSYNLSLWVNPNETGFSGQVAIDLELKNDRDHLDLHAKDLDLHSLILKDANTERPVKFSKLSDDGVIRIDFEQELPRGRYVLEISYRGNYQEDLTGLYRVKDGEDFYLYTQFEPLSARKMLPCFDEPRWKTPFNIKIISEPGLKVIANSALDASFNQGDKEVHIFKTTKPMATYLLALAVGPFDIIAGPVLGGNQYRTEPIEFRGITTKGKGHKLGLALQETPLILDKLEHYFGVAYPFDKLDILAVPDFRAGAMENVGAITFREWYLLLDEKDASVDQRRGFYVVMAHELAHQWFGNLVTMPWWDDLWLNEAFATWLSYKIVDDIRPEFKSAPRLLSRAYEAMSQDSLKAARKIREPIEKTHDIHNAFDGITYSKGGAVLSMLENYLGEEKFREAVSDHLTRFAHETASAKDFLASLARFSDGNLVKSAETFLNQTGVPQIHVSYTCKEKPAIRFEQKRYVPVGSQVEKERLWSIPVCVGYESFGELKKQCLTLSEKSQTIDLDDDTCPLFVMPNYHGQGYYRFSMDEEGFRNLLEHGKNLLSETDLIAIADALLGEFYAGQKSFGFVVDLMRNLVDSKSSILTGIFIKLLDDAKHRWVENDASLALDNYAIQALKEIYDRFHLSLDLEADQKLVQKDLTRFLATVIRDKDARFDLSVMGNTYINGVLGDDEPVALTLDENLLDPALAVALQYHEDDTVDKLMTKLDDISDTVTRGHLLYGLAHSRIGDEANTVRAFAFHKGLRKNEQLRFFYDHLENPLNQPATWQFLKDNFATFTGNLSKSQLGSLPYLAAGLCSYDDAKDVKKFFAPVIADYEGGPRNLDEVVEEIEICSARKKHASPYANNFFRDFEKKAVAVQE